MNDINNLALAFVGDAVYEVYVRKYLVKKGLVKVNDLQKEATKYVSAKGQAKILESLVNDNILTDLELDVVRKGRNSKGHRAPKNTDISTYRYSTGFETLVGYLYYNDISRLDYLMNLVTEG